MLNVLESSPIAQLAIGLDHKATYWNRACELLTGLSAEEMTGGKGPGKGCKRRALQEFLN
jgi:PAS domain S-box-containing protein